MLQVGRSSVRVPDKVDFFNLHNPSSRTMVLGLTQPLTEMSTRNLRGGKKRPARRADQPCRHLWADCLENVGASTSRNPKGLHGLHRDNFTLTVWTIFSTHLLNKLTVFCQLNMLCNVECKTPTCFKVLPRLLPGGTEEEYETYRLGYPKTNRTYPKHESGLHGKCDMLDTKLQLMFSCQ
jgi:hypothetical protein